MRVLVLGSVRQSGDSWHNDVAYEATQLGWDVTYARMKSAPASSIVNLARGADMLIWCYAHGHLPSGDAHRMLRRIEDAGTVTIGLHQDLYWGLAREHRIGGPAWWSCQHVYTADGGERNWKLKGIANHAWCPPASTARSLGLAAPTGKHRAVFIGSFVRSIHGSHRIGMINWARQRWKRDFHWHGSTVDQRIYGDIFAGVVSKADVTLGDASPAPFYWSDRVVRVMGRGGVLAHPRVEGMLEQGITDNNALLFDPFDFDKLGLMLDSLTSTERSAYREAAIETIRERHLWRHRLAQFAQRAGVL